jgi:methylated-DNA-protein-cysteine methyltransferase related protein
VHPGGHDRAHPARGAGGGALSAPLPPRHQPRPDDHEPTAFQTAVLRAVADLREGDLATYAEVAESAGHPGAGQAVANVLRSALEVPWWRVVPADGRLYRSHRAVQGPLLEAEGHGVDADGRIRPGAQGAVRTRSGRDAT